MIWNGIDVSVLGSLVTRRNRVLAGKLFAGYDVLSSWEDFLPNIPLEIRYADHCQRLAAAMSRQRAEA